MFKFELAYMFSTFSIIPHVNKFKSKKDYIRYTIQINIFKYHVSCTEGKISVRINLLLYLFFHLRPIHIFFLFLSCRPFAVNTTFSAELVGLKANSVSWLGQLTVAVYITVSVDFLKFCLLFGLGC